MIIAVLIGVTVLVAALILWRGKGAAIDAPQPARSEAEVWIEEAFAHEVGKRTELGTEAVLGALRGDPDPYVVTAVEAKVRSVKITYERLPHQEGLFEVRAEMTFE